MREAVVLCWGGDLQEAYAPAASASVQPFYSLVYLQKANRHIEWVTILKCRSKHTSINPFLPDVFDSKVPRCKTTNKQNLNRQRALQFLHMAASPPPPQGGNTNDPFTVHANAKPTHSRNRPKKKGLKQNRRLWAKKTFHSGRTKQYTHIPWKRQIYFNHLTT